VSLGITCTTQAYPVNVSVTGLPAGQTLVLDDVVGSSSDTLSVSGAAGTISAPFPHTVASGASFAVAVQSQPTNYFCSVGAGATGTVAAAAPTVSVSCVPDDVLTVSLGAFGAPLTVVVNGSSYSPSTGSFQVPIAPGAAYSVSVTSTPAGETCTLAGAAYGTTTTSGTMNGNLTVSYACDWNITVNAYNGYTNSKLGKTYPPCGALTFNLLVGGSKVDTATVTASGHSAIIFPSHPGLPWGTNVEVDFIPTSSAAGSCTCPLNTTNATETCDANGNCTVDVYSNGSLTSAPPLIYADCTESGPG
jgi:hypothetical protein